MSQALVKLGELANLPEAELKKRTPDELTALVQALRHNKVSALGDGQVFVRRGPDGFVEAVQATVTLSERKKEIYGITKDDKAKGNYSITAQGYGALNRVAGVNMVTPPWLELRDGERVPNPFLVREKDALTGMTRTRGVWVRKIAVGPTPMGNLAAVDAKLYFDLDVYFLQDILVKIKWSPECGDVVMLNGITDDDRKKFLVIPWEYGLCIKANPAHKEIRSLIETQVQRQKFAERIATTICERNALKKHPAIACQNITATGNEGDKKVSVQVIGWRKPELDQQIQDAVMQSANGETPEGMETAVINIEANEAAEGDVAGAEEEVTNEEKTAAGEASGSSSNDEEKQEEEAQPLFKPTDSVNQRLTALKKRFGEEKVAETMKDLPWDKMTRNEKADGLQKVADFLLSQEGGK